MNKQTHRTVAIISGVGLYITNRLEQQKEFNLIQLIGSGVGGYVSGSLPDTLEPARHSYHRRFCHSVTTGGCLILLRKEVYKASNWLEEQSEKVAFRIQQSTDVGERMLLRLLKIITNLLVGFVIGLLGGYLSHLVLDASTPRSIPLFG